METNNGRVFSCLTMVAMLVSACKRHDNTQTNGQKPRESTNEHQDSSLNQPVRNSGNVAQPPAASSEIVFDEQLVHNVAMRDYTLWHQLISGKSDAEKFRLTLALYRKLKSQGFYWTDAIGTFETSKDADIFLELLLDFRNAPMPELPLLGSNSWGAWGKAFQSAKFRLAGAVVSSELVPVMQRVWKEFPKMNAQDQQIVAMQSDSSLRIEMVEHILNAISSAKEPVVKEELIQAANRIVFHLLKDPSKALIADAIANELISKKIALDYLVRACGKTKQ